MTCVVGTRSVPVAISCEREVAPEATSDKERGESGRFQMQPSPRARAATVADGNHTSICWPSVSLTLLLRPEAFAGKSTALGVISGTKEASSIV